MTRVLAVLAILAAVACTADDDTADGPRAANASVDDVVRMNEIQVLGSHNSYRTGIAADLLELITAFDREAGEGLDYGHPPLRVQLEEQGVRQLELDVYDDPDGGLYAVRRGLELVGRPVASGLPELDAPGFKVLHSADIDFDSSCLTFVACLEEVRAWSDDAPSHVPVVILIEAKEGMTPDPAALGFVDPPDFDRATFVRLDDEIRSVFDTTRLITPAAIVDGRWPTLGDARGKVMFALDNTDLAEVYAGDLLFPSVDPEVATTGFVKRNDPIADGLLITDFVRRGFIVRTRADAETIQSRTNDPTMRDAALKTGAQLVSTDYVEPDRRFSDYVVALPGGAMARCNPVSAPPACDDDQLRP